MWVVYDHTPTQTSNVIIANWPRSLQCASETTVNAVMFVYSAASVPTDVSLFTCYIHKLFLRQNSEIKIRHLISVEWPMPASHSTVTYAKHFTSFQIWHWRWSYKSPRVFSWQILWTWSSSYIASQTRLIDFGANDRKYHQPVSHVRNLSKSI